MPEACITVRSQKMGLDHATVRSRVFWGLRYSPVPNLRTGPYRSPDRTGLQNHTSVRSQNSGPDRLQISPVRSGPSPTVRSGQSSGWGVSSVPSLFPSYQHLQFGHLCPWPANRWSFSFLFLSRSYGSRISPYACSLCSTRTTSLSPFL